MKLIVEKLRSMYDYIIFDSPPMGACDRRKSLATLADKVIFVVRLRERAREWSRKTLTYFVRNHKLAGVALNLVDESKTPRYGAYSNYSGYYYKKYYQN